MAGKIIFIVLAVLNLTEALMLDSALREYGVLSQDHFLHGYSNNLNLILGLRIAGSLVIAGLALKPGKISKPISIFAFFSAVFISYTIYDTYLNLILE